MRNDVDFALCLLGIGWFWCCSFGFWQLTIVVSFGFLGVWIEE